MKTIATVHGRKRTQGVIEESNVEYTGWTLHITVPSDDPNLVGDECVKKFFNDKLLEGYVPEKGDKIIIFQNFEGKVTAVKPYIENNGNNGNIRK